jgi:uncharacterized membrane protein
MNKADYLFTLKNALAGLAPEVITDILNGYEMRFIEGASLGRSEQEIVQTLDLPQVVAARFLDHPYPSAGVKKTANTEKTPFITGTRFFSFIGLSFFNLFLIIPSIVFCALLFASYVSSLGFMIGGSAYTAASLAQVDQVVLNQPKSKQGSADASNNEQAIFDITSSGITINEDEVDTRHTSGIHFGKRNSPFQASAWLGIGITLGGILLLLINLIVSKYSFIGVKRYLKLNYSILKGA